MSHTPSQKQPQACMQILKERNIPKRKSHPSSVEKEKPYGLRACNLLTWHIGASSILSATSSQRRGDPQTRHSHSWTFYFTSGGNHRDISGHLSTLIISLSPSHFYWEQLVISPPCVKNPQKWPQSKSDDTLLPLGHPPPKQATRAGPLLYFTEVVKKIIVS